MTKEYAIIPSGTSAEDWKAGYAGKPGRATSGTTTLYGTLTADWNHFFIDGIGEVTIIPEEPGGRWEFAVEVPRPTLPTAPGTYRAANGRIIEVSDQQALYAGLGARMANSGEAWWPLSKDPEAPLPWTKLYTTSEVEEILLDAQTLVETMNLNVLDPAVNLKAYLANKLKEVS